MNPDFLTDGGADFRFDAFNEAHADSAEFIGRPDRESNFQRGLFHLAPAKMRGCVDITDAKVRTEGYLKSMTASEELAVFLSLRGNCLKESGRLKEAANCFAQASKLAPTWNAYHALRADMQAAASLSVTLKS